uniref:sodium:proton antiporter NhaD n=1 Tax=Mariniflexile sp. TaxID=1979402 RepID=UPI0040474BED
MYILLAIVFIIGYIFIALEHPFKIDKAASAILTGVITWIILVLGQNTIFKTAIESNFIDESILRHVGEIAEILFFLLGAMTIVELIDTHGGFQIITSKIKTTNRIKLLWIVGLITFFLSSVLDNLTTTIVMAALLKKLMKNKEDVWFFGGIVVVAANAGGAWSPIGDVTTIMLWIGGQITALNIVKQVFLPSVICLTIPLLILSFIKKGEVVRSSHLDNKANHPEIASPFEASLILWLGIAGLLFVPIFKSLTQLPPFMGILFSLGVLWVVTEIIHKNKTEEHRHCLSVASVIRKVDTPSVLFFLGILLAVASLQTGGHLEQLAKILSDTFGNIYIINIII